MNPPDHGVQHFTPQGQHDAFTVDRYGILPYPDFSPTMTFNLRKFGQSVIFSIVVDAAPYNAMNFVWFTRSRTVNTGKGMHHGA